MPYSQYIPPIMVTHTIRICQKNSLRHTSVEFSKIKGFFYEFHTPQNLTKITVVLGALHRLTVSYATENCPKLSIIDFVLLWVLLSVQVGG